MTRRSRKRLALALLLAPLVIVLPSLWPHLAEPQFITRNLDTLIIFLALPWSAALWLSLK